MKTSYSEEIFIIQNIICDEKFCGVFIWLKLVIKLMLTKYLKSWKEIINIKIVDILKL